MRTLVNIFLALALCQNCLGQTPVQLAPPLLKSSAVFFKQAAMVELKFAEPGTHIYYTLNGQPPTENDKIYKRPIKIKKSLTTLQAITAGAGFLPSEIVSVSFVKDGLEIQSEQHSNPNEKYQGNGSNTLFDNEGGVASMKSTNWIGYQQDTVEITVGMKTFQQLNSVLINFLQDYKSWVFPPQIISVEYYNQSNQTFEFFSEKKIELNKSNSAPECRPMLLTTENKIATDRLKIKLYGFTSLPDWLAGKRRHGWIFVDEIKVY